MRTEAEVAIVGGGPVGLTLGMDLAQRGVDVVVIDQFVIDEPANCKANHISARSMENFRRLGIADDLRVSGLPADYPQDHMYCTTLTGYELSRVILPSVNDRRAGVQGGDTWWPTPEPAHRINSTFIMPVLSRHARATAGLRIIERTRAESIKQTADEVQVIARDLQTDEEHVVVAQFVVGCDGGPSMVRHAIGAVVDGDEFIQQYQTLIIEAPGLIDLFPGRRAWHCQMINPRRAGSLAAIDGKAVWKVSFPLKGRDESLETLDVDVAIRELLGVGADFEYSVLNSEDWVGRRLLVDKAHDNRVFLCGDAAHIWTPIAGYGMNAGIADAANLAWLLAAHLQGWAPQAILDAYARERMPVTNQVSHHVRKQAVSMMEKRAGVSEHIEDPGPLGQQARAEMRAGLVEPGRRNYCAAGLNFGYYYDDSPLIAYDGDTAPDYSIGDFVETTVPGCRTPHVWLADGRSLYDAMGEGYALVTLDPSIDVQPLVAAAAARGVPLRVVTVDGAHDAYDRMLVLARPDRHVAWRGDALPDDVELLVDVIRGAAIWPRESA